MRTAIIVMALLLALATAGCGQTGPLYLPDEGPTENPDDSASE